MPAKIKEIYGSVYTKFAHYCSINKFYERTPFARVYDIDTCNKKGLSFKLHGCTTGNQQALPNFYIDDDGQKSLLDKFRDEKTPYSWSYPYGVIELEKAFISFPYPIHRFGNGILRRGVGDSEHCLCQPRFLIAYLSTFMPLKGELDSAIMLTLPFHENYYHWTIETLPRLKMVLEKPDYDNIPIVIPTHRTPRFVKESIIQAGAGSRVIALDNGAYQINKLIIPTLFAPRSKPSEAAMSWLEQKILGPDIDTDSFIDDSFERIYISRDDAGTRSVINSEEIDALLKRYGIKKLKMTDYSVHQQAKIFRKAKLIIGLHGAALANVAYASIGSTLIELFMDGLFTKAFFNLARFREMKYGCLLCKQHQGNIIIDAEKLNLLVHQATH